MIQTKKVEPIGSRTTMAFVFCSDASKSGMKQIVLPVYPPSRGDEFREERVSRNICIREGARLFGWSAVELGEVERGARVPEDWEAAFAKLREFCPECRCEKGHKMDCSRRGLLTTAPETTR